MKRTDFTSKQISFLRKLNALLTKKEKELWERCVALMRQYEKRRKKFGGDLDDYEIEIIVEYQTSAAMLRPRYCFTEHISRSDYYEFYSDTPKQHLGIGAPSERWGIADGNDHSDMGFPDIGEKWCYFMHALLSHSNIKIEKIFKVFRIDFEVNITEQQFIEITKYEIFA